MKQIKTPTYKLNFFFEYGSGSCLWPGNEAARGKFDVGPLDAESFDLEGKVSQEAKIKLPDPIKRRISELDSLYSESLDWNNPGGPSLWDDQQWELFYKQTRALHKNISEILEDEYEIIYRQKRWREKS